MPYGDLDLWVWEEGADRAEEAGRWTGKAGRCGVDDLDAAKLPKPEDLSSLKSKLLDCKQDFDEKVFTIGAM